MLLVLDSQDVLQRPRSDEDSDGVELGRLQPPHSVGRHIQDAVLPLNTHTHRHNTATVGVETATV